MAEQADRQDGGKRFDRESIRNVLVVAVSLSLICSVMVSATAVMLRPLQERNETLNRKQNVLTVAGLMAPGVDVAARFEAIETRVVDLATGEYTDAVDPAGFDMVAAAEDPELSVAIAPDKDLAGIGRRSKYAEVYLVRDDAGALDMVILPVYGMGLWSTMYGFIALGPDGSTIRGFKFYKHAETPGLGGEVDNPQWLAQWPGKLIYDQDGQFRFRVSKGSVGGGEWTGATANAGPAAYHVDAISGSTLTSRGVSNLVAYWMGEDAYKPYLRKIWQRSLEQ